MYEQFNQIEELEENKDESKEKDRFLNIDETLVEVTRDNNSLYRCLAHQKLKNQNLYENIKSLVADELKEQKIKLIPSVINQEEFDRLISVVSAPLSSGEWIHAFLYCYSK